MTVMESVLVVFGMTEWMCIAIAMHISQFRLSKTGFFVNICFCNLSNIGETFSVYDSRYTGKFCNMLFLKDDNLDLDDNHCGRVTEHPL